MRRLSSLLVVLACLLSTSSLVRPTGAAPVRQGALETHVYLPFGLRGIGLSALAPPRVVVLPTRTPPPSDTPAPTASATLPPTFTPVPSATPTTPVGGADVRGQLTVDGEPAIEGLGDGFGPGLLVRECFADETCEWIARTGVDAEGRFHFHIPVPPPEGGFYQVVWRNETPGSGSPYSGADLWLGSFYGPEMRPIDVGDEIDLGPIEIADIVLVAPTNGSGFSGLPWTFEWELREAETGNYRWAFCEAPCQTVADRERDTFFTTPSLGRETQYVMESYPPGTKIGQDHKYRWYIWVDLPNGGVGESYYARMLWFFLEAFARFGLVDPADWPGWQVAR